MAMEAESGVFTTAQPWSTDTIKKLAMLARLLILKSWLDMMLELLIYDQ